MLGGSGFIASYFREPLRQLNHQVVSYDLVEPSPQTADCPFVRADIRDPRTLAEAMAGCDAVLHLAAAHHDFGISEQTFHDVNVRGAEYICEAMDQHGVRDVCFYSSVAVYGQTAPPLDETADPKPDSPYGATKHGAELVFREWVAKGDQRRCLVVRPTVTFGPRNFANMYTLIHSIARGRFLPVGSGQNVKSVAYVENLVEATLYLWLKQRDQFPDFDVFNYVDKPDLTSEQITQVVYDALKKRRPRLRVPLGLALFLALPFDLIIRVTGRNLPVSGARIRKLASTETLYEADKVHASGFEAPVPLEEGIRRMVRWYLEEGKDQRAVWHQPPAEPVLQES